MTRLRTPVLVAVVFGLLVSFTTGVGPAGAGTSSTKPGENFSDQQDVWVAEWPSFMDDLNYERPNMTNCPAGYTPCLSTIVMNDTAGNGFSGGIAFSHASLTGAQITFFRGGATTGSCDFYWGVYRWENGSLVAERPVSLQGTLTTNTTHTWSIGGVSPFSTYSADDIFVFGWAGYGTSSNALRCGVMQVAGTLNHLSQLTGGFLPHLASPAPTEAEEFTPRLACGRTLRDMGNGQWFADAQAIVRNPPTSGAADSPGFWYSSWDPFVDFDTGPTTTFPLPAGASTNDSLWVTYVMERTYTAPIGWKMPTTQGVVAVDVETKGGVVIPGISWVMKAAAKLAGEVIDDDADWEDQFVNEAVGGGTVTVYVDGDEVGDTLPDVPELVTQVRKIKATCTMRVSPVTDHVDPPTIVVNVPPHSGDPIYNEGDSTTIINNPPPPGSTDSDASCGGGSWWNPITWSKSLYCRLGDIYDAIRGLKFPGLDDVGLGFIAGLATGWLAKFPLSVISEVVDAFGALRTALDAGMDSACGPTFEPDFSGVNLYGRDQGDTFRVSLPSPNAECPQSEWSRQAADLGGFRAPLRGFFEVLLWGGFLLRAVHSIGPGRSDPSPDV